MVSVRAGLPASWVLACRVTCEDDCSLPTPECIIPTVSGTTTAVFVQLLSLSLVLFTVKARAGWIAAGFRCSPRHHCTPLESLTHLNPNLLSAILSSPRSLYSAAGPSLFFPACSVTVKVAWFPGFHPKGWWKLETSGGRFPRILLVETSLSLDS